MEVVALLRGVTPVGKNKVPKMAYLVAILQEAGFKNVRSWIQSGNVILETACSFAETAQIIHDVILEKIGADLAIVIKTKQALQKAVAENPFVDDHEASRILLVFTNDQVDAEKVQACQQLSFGDEVFYATSQCFYLYLPRDAAKKKLNNNYLERQLGIVATSRKLSVVQQLLEK